MKNIRVIVSMSLFITIEIILTRFFSIQTPIVRIGFTFLPIAISAMLFGPLLSGTIAALADLIGMLLFPVGGAYFPGFTLTAFLTGVIYGFILYKKGKTLLRVSIAVIIVSVFIQLGLDTIWLWILTGKGFLAILPTRIMKCMINIPIEIILIRLVWNSLSKFIEHSCIGALQNR